MIGKILKAIGIGGEKKYENLDSSAFVEMSKEKNSVLIDVRTPAEYKGGHIPGAKNINVSDSGFMKKLEGLDKSKKYMVYCRSGSRSAMACSIMARAGFTNLNNLRGGIMAYRGKLA